MNQNELIELVSKEAGISKKEAKLAVEAIKDLIQKALKNGDKITILGFGIFSIVEKKARVGINPKMGKPIKVAAKKVAKFKPGKTFANLIVKETKKNEETDDTGPRFKP